MLCLSCINIWTDLSIVVNQVFSTNSNWKKIFLKDTQIFLVYTIYSAILATIFNFFSPAEFGENKFITNVYQKGFRFAVFQHC